MRRESLERNLRRQALGWMISGIVLTLALAGSLSVALMFRDTERQVENFATSAIASDRTEILSGNVRSTELNLRKSLGIRDGEALLFLDEKRAPWVGDLRPVPLEACSSGSLCRKWITHKIVLEKPIFFDEEGKQLWGYLHIERTSEANWPLVLSVALAVIAGMLFQGLGAYFKTAKSVRVVSETLASWAERLSANPKDRDNYQEAPFAEIEPIGMALVGLKDEIDALERAARQQGALVTLRGVGHDILNPVARMKRLLGLLEVAGPDNQEHLASLRANLKRLSGYAEQLKLIYKRQNGEITEVIPLIDVSSEIRALAKELLGDPETIEKKLRLEVEIVDGCRARIPVAALGRAVENLCNNSIHASGTGATVTLRVTPVGGSVAICVEDTGSGIPLEYHGNIFEPNFTTKANRGTGLGLFVVKQICEQYEGKLSFLSRPGATAFTLELPKGEVNYGS